MQPKGDAMTATPDMKAVVERVRDAFTRAKCGESCVYSVDDVLALCDAVPATPPIQITDLEKARGDATYALQGIATSARAGRAIVEARDRCPGHVLALYTEVLGLRTGHAEAVDGLEGYKIINRNKRATLIAERDAAIARATASEKRVEGLEKAGRLIATVLGGLDETDEPGNKFWRTRVEDAERVATEHGLLQCKPMWGSCCLPSGHKGQHDASAPMRSGWDLKDRTVLATGAALTGTNGEGKSDGN